MDSQASCNVLLFFVLVSLLLSGVGNCGPCPVMQPFNKAWSLSDAAALQQATCTGLGGEMPCTVVGPSSRQSNFRSCLLQRRKDSCQLFKRTLHCFSKQKFLLLLPHIACYIWFMYQQCRKCILYSIICELCLLYVWKTMNTLKGHSDLFF